MDDPKGRYFSDYDLLVVVNDTRLTDMAEVWYLAEERLSRDAGGRTIVSFIVHTLAEVNEALQKGQYFFTDIVKEGVALYELYPRREFARPGVLSAEEAKAEAGRHHEQWMRNAESFVRGYQSAIGFGDLKLAAFLMHQAVEALYRGVLLSKTN